jgi:hypothetical protein
VLNVRKIGDEVEQIKELKVNAKMFTSVPYADGNSIFVGGGLPLPSRKWCQFIDPWLAMNGRAELPDLK